MSIRGWVYRRGSRIKRVQEPEILGINKAFLFTPSLFIKINKSWIKALAWIFQGPYSLFINHFRKQGLKSTIWAIAESLSNYGQLRRGKGAFSKEDPLKLFFNDLVTLFTFSNRTDPVGKSDYIPSGVINFFFFKCKLLVGNQRSLWRCIF